MFKLINLENNDSVWVNTKQIVTVDFNTKTMTLSDGQSIVFSEESYCNISDIVQYMDKI